jgi:4-diphosphocytidyl-2-C-methyl-D-erythritol kinase
MAVTRDIAAAKLNLALHVRGQLPDGRHAIETIYAFCVDGDRLSTEISDELSLRAEGPFASDLPPPEDNLAFKAALALREAAGVTQGAAITLEKRLPVASGIGGGSADAAAVLRLLTSLWKLDPAHAEKVAPMLGSDVPACLLSLPMRGEGAGDELTPIALPGLSGAPVLLINPRQEVSTAQAFAGWSGKDLGPLGDWREGRNDLEKSATALAPLVGTVLAWLSVQPGSNFTRMSGSGATCFSIFDSDEERDAAWDRVPREWWRLATRLR